jgi:AbrB family looped-hinge helix DNA binding protein
MTIKISTKGWIVIPSALRRKYNLEPGVDVHVVDYGGVLSIVPAFENPVNNGVGLLKGADSLTEAILDEHRQERERDA